MLETVAVIAAVVGGVLILTALMFLLAFLIIAAGETDGL